MFGKRRHALKHPKRKRQHKAVTKAKDRTKRDLKRWLWGQGVTGRERSFLLRSRSKK